MGTKKIRGRVGKNRTTFWQEDWRNVCGKVLDVGLKGGWIRVEQCSGKDSVSWDDSWILMDNVSSFLTSYGLDTHAIELLRRSTGSSYSRN